MRKRVLISMAVLVAAVSAWAAESPFVGNWKLNPAKSRQIDEMRVASLGGNKYSFDFGGGEPEVAVADGTDQPGHFGIMIAVSIDGPEKWTVVRKKDGKVLVTGVWTLGNDGKTLHDRFTAVQPNGSTSTTDYVYERRGGGEGFIGDWVSTTQTSSAVEMQVKPFEGDGLSFVSPGGGGAANVKFDGKDYEIVGAVVKDLTASARQVDGRTLELTDKIGGKVIDTQEVNVSEDGKTLTITRHVPGRSEPDVMVFERE